MRQVRIQRGDRALSRDFLHCAPPVPGAHFELIDQICSVSAGAWAVRERGRSPLGPCLDPTLL